MSLESSHTQRDAPPQLIETLRSDEQGKIPLLHRHLQRLHRSAQYLEYVCPVHAIEQALVKAAEGAQGEHHRLRLLLQAHGGFNITVQAFDYNPGRPAQKVGIARPRLDASSIWLRHKTTRRPLYDQAQSWLQQHPTWFDLIFLNQKNELCEGSRSNLYLLLDGQWYTPPQICGVLPGIQRGILLEAGLVRERVLPRSALADAKALRLSNALHGWFDVKLDQPDPVEHPL
ncbi:aminotransferase [Alcaligenaceae bacterium SJ-26]|nr:aminotransferase [Alcaligenaceae bacterium SJ-26]